MVTTWDSLNAIIEIYRDIKDGTSLKLVFITNYFLDKTISKLTNHDP